MQHVSNDERIITSQWSELSSLFCSGQHQHLRIWLNTCQCQSKLLINQFMLVDPHRKDTTIVGAYCVDLELCMGTKMLQQRTTMVKTASWKNRVVLFSQSCLSTFSIRRKRITMTQLQENPRSAELQSTIKEVASNPTN